jgi:hypothetical protein
MIVGDTVNATQRLESLGKTIDPEAEAIGLWNDALIDICLKCCSYAT